MLSWIDECAWMAAAKDFPSCTFVTRAMDRIDFKHQVKNGSILRFNTNKTQLGNTSVTYLVEVHEDERSTIGEKLAFSTSVTFVNIDAWGKKKKID